MRWGIIRLWCPICGSSFLYDQNKPGPYYHHREFGILESKDCFEKAEVKYAKMILGKDDE